MLRPGPAVDVFMLSRRAWSGDCGPLKRKDRVHPLKGESGLCARAISDMCVFTSDGSWSDARSQTLDFHP